MRVGLRRAVAGLAASAMAARMSAYAVSEERPASPLDGLTYKEIVRGQLAPPRPRFPFESTACGTVVYENGIGWQKGSYGSLWLRLGLDAGAKPTTPEELGAAVDTALARTKGAIYVGIQELAIEPGVSGMLRARGFKYHHFRQAPPDGKDLGVGNGLKTGEHVYYRWNGDPKHDMVPSYATSIEGVGGLLLSPDESKVLLIWEYGNWKPMTGAVDDGESALSACEREMREEVSATVDHEFKPVFVGGWQMARARDDKVNDNFKAFVLRAASEEYAVDENEVSEARWFSCKELLELYQRHGSPNPMDKRSLEESTLPEGRRKISTNALTWLETYAGGGGLPTTRMQRPSGADWTFIGGQRSKL